MRTSILSLIAAVAVLVSGAAGQQKGTNHVGAILGVKVRPAVIQLRAEVEKLYGRPVCVKIVGMESDCPPPSGEVLKSDDPSSLVSANGTPVIYLSKATMNEETIAHELFHFKMRAKGYPTLMITVAGGLNRDVIGVLLGRMYDAIVHSMFDKEMHKLGFDPDRDVEHRYQVLLKDSEANDALPEVDQDAFSLLYLTQTIECGRNCKEKRILEKMAELFNQKGWLGVLEKGKRLVAIYNASPSPVTPDETLHMVLRVASELFKGKLRVTGPVMKSEERGSFTEQYAVFTVTRP